MSLGVLAHSVIMKNYYIITVLTSQMSEFYQGMDPICDGCRQAPASHVHMFLLHGPALPYSFIGVKSLDPE